MRPPLPASPARPGSVEGDPLEAARPRRPADRLELSDAWRNREADGSGTAGVEEADREPAAAPAESAESAESPESPESPAPAEGGPRGADGEPLSDREQQELKELQARDTEVRTHEQAHKAVGGRYAGAISYTYTTGPDGRRYVTGGSVPIDMSPVPGDPEATIAKMRIVRAAAMAPAEPSPQDRSVAAAADRAAAQAMTEAAKQRMEEAAPDRADRSDAADRDGGGSTGGDAAESRGLTAVAGAPERSIDPVRRDAVAAYRSRTEPTPVPGLSLVA